MLRITVLNNALIISQNQISNSYKQKIENNDVHMSIFFKTVNKELLNKKRKEYKQAYPEEEDSWLTSTLMLLTNFYSFALNFLIFWASTMQLPTNQTQRFFFLTYECPAWFVSYQLFST